ncbi:uncharacterized protein LOC136026228 [Artemia franciscana]|uniref:uncharacterized protein LOC136026228 n=1 Tax=Artemia franciscana TaxID=6661 RepID=UPI0032DA30DA
MKIEYTLVVVLNVVYQVLATDPEVPSPRKANVRTENQEDIKELDKFFDEKLSLLSDSFRNNEMDPMKIRIAPMPKNAPVRRWAMQNVRHKSEVKEYIGERKNDKLLDKFTNPEDEFVLVSLEDGPQWVYVEYSALNTTVENPANESGPDVEPKPKLEPRYDSQNNYNAELYGLSDFTRNQSVIIRRPRPKGLTETVIVPFLVGPFRLIMLSPDLDDPLHATHAVAESIPAEMVFRRKDRNLKFIRLRLPRITARTVMVFLSKTEKFASRKEELNAARLATHVSFALSRLWMPRSPLLDDITTSYRNFFNV